MPTSGAWEVGNSGRGQSAVGLSRLALRQPAWPWQGRRPLALVQQAKGRSCVAGRRTERRRHRETRRRMGKNWGMAHLDVSLLFRFCSPVKNSPPGPPRLQCLALCIENTASPFSSPVRSASWYSIFLGAFRMRASSFTRILFLVQPIARCESRFRPNSWAKPATSAPAKSCYSRLQRSHAFRRFAPLPILILAHGNEPNWSLRLGMKGPSARRAGYPRSSSNPTNRTRRTWRLLGLPRKDAVTGADVAVELFRDSCSEALPTSSTPSKSSAAHADRNPQRVRPERPEKFPEFRKKNQLDPDDSADDKDKDKSKDKD